MQTFATFSLDLPAGEFDAYIFDCDGTLADTMPTHYKAWLTALGEHARDFPEAMFYELGGVPTARIVEILNERHGHSLPVDQTVAHKESLFLEMSHEIAAIEPVVALARQYHGHKPLAVASGGHRRIVMNTLRALGIAELFGAIVCSEDTSAGNPPRSLSRSRASSRCGSRALPGFRRHGHRHRRCDRAGMQSVLVPPPRR